MSIDGLFFLSVRNEGVSMRIVDWNIEHMNSWFVANDDEWSPALRRSYSPGRNSRGGGAIGDVPALAKRAAAVLGKLDPDLICIQEGAGEEEVTLFLDRYLSLPGSKAWQVLGGSGGRQKLVVAARLDRDIKAMESADDSGLQARLKPQFEADIDGDSVFDTARFARVPQVVDLKAHGTEIRVVNCHLKSKHVGQGPRLWRGSEEERLQYTRAALAARRRISAEAFRIRGYLDKLFEIDPDRLLLLVGDLNDGPGFDYFERRYLTHGITDIVFGSILRPRGRLTHPLIREGEERPASAYFDDFVEGIDDKPLLLDHIGLSPALSGWRVKARVADAEFDAEARPKARNKRERLPSDHRPIVVEMKP